MPGIALFRYYKIKAFITIQVGQSISVRVSGGAYIKAPPVTAAISGILPPADPTALPFYIACTRYRTFPLYAIAAAYIEKTVSVNIADRITSPL
jgi:hypothetical protein